MSNDPDHDRIWDASEIVHDAKAELWMLAKAFETTGNSAMAQTLLSLSGSLTTARDALQKIARKQDPKYDPERIHIMF